MTRCHENRVRNQAVRFIRSTAQIAPNARNRMIPCDQTSPNVRREIPAIAMAPTKYSSVRSMASDALSPYLAVQNDSGS